MEINPKDLVTFDTEVIPWPTYLFEWVLCLITGPLGRIWIENKLINDLLISEGINPSNTEEFQHVLAVIGDKVTTMLVRPDLQWTEGRAYLMKFRDNPVAMRVGRFSDEVFVFLPKKEFEVCRSPRGSVD